MDRRAGLIGAPICITNTYSVGVVRDAVCALAVRERRAAAFHPAGRGRDL